MDGGMPRSLWYIEGNVHLHLSFGLHLLYKTIQAAYGCQYHMVGCQEQDGMDQVIWYASRSLSISESHYPAHKLEYLALKWAVTEIFKEYLYGNTYALYSNNNPLTYILSTAKLDASGQKWIAKFAKFNFTVYYCSGKSNVNVDMLSRIPWDHNIKAEAVKTIFKVDVEGHDALMEVYGCHEKTISSLILESPTTWMTVMDWV